MILQLHMWIKSSKVRGRIRGKTVTISDPDFRAVLQDAAFMWDFEFILNVAIYLSETNLSQMVSFELSQNITRAFTCGLRQAFWLLLNELLVNEANSAQEWGIYGKDVMDRLNNRDGKRGALSAPVLYSRICLCFFRVALSFHLGFLFILKLPPLY